MFNALSAIWACRSTENSFGGKLVNLPVNLIDNPSTFRGKTDKPFVLNLSPGKMVFSTNKIPALPTAISTVTYSFSTNKIPVLPNNLIYSINVFRTNAIALVPCRLSKLGG